MLDFLTMFFSAVAAIAAIKSSRTAKKEANLNSIQWRHILHNEKPQINLEIKACCLGPFDKNVGDYAIFSIIFNNTSSLDISVTRILVEHNNHTLEFEWQSKTLYPHEKYGITTSELPLYIPAMRAKIENFVVYKYDIENTCVDLNKITSSPFKIKLQTSRNYNPTYTFEKAPLKYDI